MDKRSFIKGCIYTSLFGAVAAGGFKYGKKIFTNENGEPYLPYIEIHLVDHCNLNCKYCCHFSSIADKHFYDLKQYEKDLKKLYQFTEGRIKIIRLLGGEPLLNPDINKYITTARKYFKDVRIVLVTNGILLTKMNEKFWKTLYNNNILLDISVYDININWDEVFYLIKKYKIKIIWPDEKNKPIEYFYNIALDLKGSQKDLNKCKNCFSYECFELLDGKIYPCPIVAFINYFNKKFNQNVKVSDTDFIALDNINTIQDFIKWANEPKEFCRYCGNPVLMKWEHTKKHTINEWVVNT